MCTRGCSRRESGGGRSDGLTDSKGTSCALGRPSACVSLPKGGSGRRELTLPRCVFRVRSGRGSSFTFARVERAVCIVSRHSPLASHNVKLVFTLQGGPDVFPIARTYPQAELIAGDVAHPLLVELVGSCHVGRYIATDGIAKVLSAMRIEFSTWRWRRLDRRL
jgi:hypothetical protein